VHGGRWVIAKGVHDVRLVCLVCACETDLSYYLSLPDGAPFSCPQCDDHEPGVLPNGFLSAPGSVAPSPLATTSHEAA
jgi:hypothetical protein